MESSYDVTQNQLHIINGLINRLIESQGLGTELNTNEPTVVSAESKSKILSMLKVREKLQGRLPKQQSKQDKNLELLIGNFYYCDNQYTKAINSYDKLLKVDPNNLNSLVNKGIATSKLGNHKEAIALYDKVLEIDPNYFDALHCKGDSLTLLSKHDEALSCYEQTLEIDPNYFDGLYKKGLALLNLQNHKEAIFHFDKALSIEPNHIPSLVNKGIATSKLGNHKEAIAL
ncbi:MAG TPA: tetratricopeptide repeat protein, partial [Candidatus Nitrosotenuis sp.]